MDHLPGSPVPGCLILDEKMVRTANTLHKSLNKIFQIILSRRLHASQKAAFSTKFNLHPDFNLIIKTRNLHDSSPIL